MINKATLAITIVILASIIGYLLDYIKGLRSRLSELEISQPTTQPFNAERMAAAQMHWSEQMTRVDRAEGRDNWRYLFAEQKFQEATAAMINNMDPNMDPVLVGEVQAILDELENN